MGYLSARGTPYEKKYFTRRLACCCLFLVIPAVFIGAAILLVPVVHSLAIHTTHVAQLHVQSANISDPGNSSFPIVIEAQVKKTGIFPARLTFRKPIDIFWYTPPPNMREVHLGRTNFGHIGVAAGHGTVLQATQLDVVDQDAFATFAQFLVTSEEFTWRLVCPEVHAEVFSFFPVYKPIPFTKDVVIKGLNNLQNISIVDFQIPGDDPAGGFSVQALTSLVNPSPFGIGVGTLNLALYYEDLYLGPVSVNKLNLQA